MPTEDDLTGSILHFVGEDRYPDSDHIVSSALPSTVFPHLLDAIEQSRAKLKNDLRTVSTAAAPDVDAWIVRARTLQTNLDAIRTETAALDRATHEAGRLRARARDAAATVGFLRGEVGFSAALRDALERIRAVAGELEGGWEAVRAGDVKGAMGALGRVEEGMEGLGGFEGGRFVGLLRERARRVREEVVGVVRGYWGEVFAADPEGRRVVVKKVVSGEIEIRTEEVVEFAAGLGIYDELAARLQQGLERAIITPRFGPENADDSAVLTIDGNTLRVSPHEGRRGSLAAIDDIKKLTQFVASELPSQLSGALSSKLVQSLTNHLISTWLQEAIPISLEEMNQFQELLDQVLSLAKHLEGLGWSGNDDLVNWVNTAPRSWLSKRKEAMLAAVRTSCYRGVRTRKTVERVETQLVSHEDFMVSQPDQANDWDAEWDNDATEVEGTQPDEPQPTEDEDMDASAWGLDEDDQPEQETKEEEQAGNDEDGGDDAEAWGWGDDDAEGATSAQEAAPTKPASKSAAGNAALKQTKPEPRTTEVTLRENYTVTAIPDEILQLIQECVADAESLAQEKYADSPIAGAAIGLYSIPTLALAMYRATASTYYSKDNAGNILVYNDCSRLADQLHSYLDELTARDETSALPATALPSKRLRLAADLTSLASFGRRAYGREMDAQRTILGDLLEGAQGFSHCTEPPFAAECEGAVRYTVDRIRQVCEEWRPILSHSALLQSIGSLVSTVLGKVILDIEDMADISEEESKRLSELCTVVTTVSALFVQKDDAGEERDMTGVYTPNWFKFRYLIEILESSLADIKFAWTEAGLRDEFEADEVVDLIQALFAESEHRRRAIAEIRRTATR